MMKGIMVKTKGVHKNTRVTVEERGRDKTGNTGGGGCRDRGQRGTTMKRDWSHVPAYLDVYYQPLMF